MTDPANLRALIAEAQALDEKATKGPWAASEDEPGDVVIYGPTEDWLANVGNWARQHPELDAEECSRQCVEMHDGDDAAFIARSRTILPAIAEAAGKMLAVVEAARKWGHSGTTDRASEDALLNALRALDGAA